MTREESDLTVAFLCGLEKGKDIMKPEIARLKKRIERLELMKEAYRVAAERIK